MRRIGKSTLFTMKLTTDLYDGIKDVNGEGSMAAFVRQAVAEKIQREKRLERETAIAR